MTLNHFNGSCMLSSVTLSPTGRYNDDKATDEEEHDSEDDCEECPAGTHGPKEGADDFGDCRDCQIGNLKDLLIKLRARCKPQVW